jgi:putative NADH-flavin reductase
MKIAIFGATGGTGQELTAHAIDAGHEVTALTRSPEKLTNDDVTIVEGDVLDIDCVKTTIDDTNAVFCLLGKTPGNPNDVVSRGTTNILDAMDEQAIDRLVVLTSMGLGASVDLVPWYVRVANATVLHELMADKARQEEIVMGSGLEWTIVRPGGLVDEPASGNYVAGTDVDVGARPIPRADVADFLLDVVESGSYLKAAPVVTADRPIDAEFLWEQLRTVSERVIGSGGI